MAVVTATADEAQKIIADEALEEEVIVFLIIQS